MKGSILGHALLVASILILQFSSHINSYTPTRPLPTQTSTQYIETSCNNTLYPRLCFRSLSIYASKIKMNPKILVNTALNVTLNSTKSTSRLMRRISKIHGLKPREASAIIDCVEQVRDSVDELQESIGEMERVNPGGWDFYKIMSDIQTWVSAALTDDNTCMDGLEEGRISGNMKIIVRRHVLRIAHLTSNALALVNSYASTGTGTGTGSPQFLSP